MRNVSPVMSLWWRKHVSDMDAVSCAFPEFNIFVSGHDEDVDMKIADWTTVTDLTPTLSSSCSKGIAEKLLKFLRSTRLTGAGCQAKIASFRACENILEEQVSEIHVWHAHEEGGTIHITEWFARKATCTFLGGPIEALRVQMKLVHSNEIMMRRRVSDVNGSTIKGENGESAVHIVDTLYDKETYVCDRERVTGSLDPFALFTDCSRSASL